MDGDALQHLLERASEFAFPSALVLLLAWLLVREKRLRREAREMRPLLTALQGTELPMRVAANQGWPAGALALIRGGKGQQAGLWPWRKPAYPVHARLEGQAEALQWRIAARR
jgi:hypothetical protein